MSLEVWKLHTYPTHYGIIRRAEEQKDGVEVDHKEEHKEEEKLRSVSVLLSLLL